MDPAALLRSRLTAQRIVGSDCRRPADAVRRLLAVQAQDRGQALWAVGSRVPGAAEADVAGALDAGAVVRTWPMRGTLHAVAAEDVRWLVGLLAPRAVAKAAGRFRQLGLDADQLARADEVVRAELSGGGAATRAQLYATFDRAGLAPEGQRGIHLLGRLAQDLVLCLGPLRERQPTFVLLDDWVPAERDDRPDDPVAELARRYVAGHGPATAHDLAWWSGLPVTQAREALRRASGLTEVAGEGAAWFCAADAPPPAPAGGAALLAAFDEFLLGFRDRSAALPDIHAALVQPGSNGVFRPIVVLDGQVVGTWRRAGRDRTALELELWRPPTPGERSALAAAAERYAAFLGAASALSVTVAGR